MKEIDKCFEKRKKEKPNRKMRKTDKSFLR